LVDQEHAYLLLHTHFMHQQIISITHMHTLQQHKSCVSTVQTTIIGITFNMIKSSHKHTSTSYRNNHNL